MEKLLKTGLVALVFAGVALLAPSAARADTVSFGTTGSVVCASCTGSGTNSVTFGSGGNLLTLTFTGVPPGTTVDASPSTFTSFGQIQTSVSGTGAAIAAGTTFTLTINQTLPGIGTGDFSATLAGVISQNSSTGMVTFTVTSVTVGGAKYDVLSNPLVLVPPSTNNGVSTIQGQVTSVPEPASLLLLGAGLIAVAGVVRRKLKPAKTS
jgi:hypothetical protein